MPFIYRTVLVLLCCTAIVASLRYSDNTNTEGETVRHHSESRRDRRAIGGDVFRRGKWPMLTLLKATIVTRRLFGIFPISHYHLYCGGALISDRWILSAAHCFTESTGSGASRPWNWEARLGAVRLKPNFQQMLLNLLGKVLEHDDFRQWDISVDEVVKHPGYNASAQYMDDIALVKLSRPVPRSRRLSRFIQRVTLPRMNDVRFPEPGETCVTMGWGCTASGGAPSSVARQVEMPVYPDRLCQAHYNLRSMDRRLCAGYRNREMGVCKGDSGSPLVCRRGAERVLAGIVSFTSRNRPESYPAGFTRVKDYLPWIQQVTGLDLH